LSTDDDAKGSNEAMNNIPDSNANGKGTVNVDEFGHDGMHSILLNVDCHESTRWKHDHDHKPRGIITQRI
jgi:hypothetical protein